MTLTVRLDAATESALERYCTQRGVTKSLVVQERVAHGRVHDVHMSALLHKYADQDPDWADVALVRLAGVTGITRIATPDVADFSGYRIHGRRRFEIELLRGLLHSLLHSHRADCRAAAPAHAASSVATSAAERTPSFA